MYKGRSRSRSRDGKKHNRETYRHRDIERDSYTKSRFKDEREGYRGYHDEAVRDYGKTRGGRDRFEREEPSKRDKIRDYRSSYQDERSYRPHTSNNSDYNYSSSSRYFQTEDKSYRSKDYSSRGEERRGGDRGRDEDYRRSDRDYKIGRNESYSYSHHYNDNHYNKRESKDDRNYYHNDKKDNKDKNDRKERDVSDSSSLRSSEHDDTVGHYTGKEGEVINSRYKIVKDAGLGTFGRVIECIDLKNINSTTNRVCIKVVRNIEKYTDGAKVEAEILTAIRKKDVHKSSLCVEMFDSFVFNGHFCLVFEKLGASLYEFVKANDYQGFPYSTVVHFAHQICQSMSFLKSMNLVHTDLKPENILLVDDSFHTIVTDRDTKKQKNIPNKSNIKVIDFGGATYDNEYKSTTVNTRQYRAPEVILGIGWSFASDMWGVGCILMEMYIGELLFGTHETFEHLALIEQIVGHIPTSMVRKVDRDHETYRYFTSENVLKTSSLPGKSLHYVNKQLPLRDQIHRDHNLFLDFIKKCLIVDPILRLKPEEALLHPLFNTAKGEV